LPHAWTLPEALRFLQKWCIGLSYRLATVLMPTTRGATAELIDVFGITPERIEIVPHGAYLIEKTAPPNDLKSLLVFGTLRRNKGVLEAIQAVQKCRREGIQCTLKLAGSPDKLDNGYWASCEQQISKAPEGISTEIGFIPDERIPDLIAQSDAVLLPYRDFTSQSGVAVLMISGLRPVIASSVGGIKDLFDIGMVGMPLSERPDVDELAEAIKTFFQTSSHIWYKRCVDAREQVNSNIGWQAIGRRYSEIIFQRNQH
jgi:glycosyltransferase involved in cell wall biosynthesis